jgi:hypothetical protein
MSACFHLPSVVCDNCAHYLRSDTVRPVATWTSNTITTSGWQMPASMVPPPDSFTRQQVEAMLRIALTDRTDEWTIKSVDERVAILLAMFTKEKP